MLIAAGGPGALQTSSSSGRGVSQRDDRRRGAMIVLLPLAYEDAAGFEIQFDFRQSAPSSEDQAVKFDLTNFDKILPVSPRTRFDRARGADKRRSAAGCPRNHRRSASGAVRFHKAGLRFIVSCPWPRFSSLAHRQVSVLWRRCTWNHAPNRIVKSSLRVIGLTRYASRRGPSTARASFRSSEESIRISGSVGHIRREQARQLRGRSCRASACRAG